MTGQEQTQKRDQHRTSPRPHSSLPLFFLWRTSQQNWHLLSVLCACLSPLQRHYPVGLSLQESLLSVASCVIHCEGHGLELATQFPCHVTLRQTLFDIRLTGVIQMDKVFYRAGSCSAGEPRAPAWPSPPSRLQIIVPKVDKWPRVLTVTRAAHVQAFLHQEYTGPHTCTQGPPRRSLSLSGMFSLYPGAVSSST